MLKLTLAFFAISSTLAQVPVVNQQQWPMPENNPGMQNEFFNMAPQPIPVFNPVQMQEAQEVVAPIQVPQPVPVVNPVQIQEIEVQPIQAPVAPFLAHPYGDGLEPFYRDDMVADSLPSGAVMKAFRDSDDSDDDSDRRGRIVNDRRRPRTTTRRTTTRRPTTTTRPAEVGNAGLPCGFSCSRKTVLLYLDNVWNSASCSDTNADVRVRCDNCCKARGLNAGIDGDWSAGFVSNNARECICCHQNAQCGGRPVPFNG